MRSSTGATQAGATASMTMRGCSFFNSENSGCAINASPIQFGAITNARRIYVSSSLKNNAAHTLEGGRVVAILGEGARHPASGTRTVRRRGARCCAFRIGSAAGTRCSTGAAAASADCDTTWLVAERKSGRRGSNRKPLLFAMSTIREDSMTLDRFAVFELVARAAIRATRFAVGNIEENARMRAPARHVGVRAERRHIFRRQLDQRHFLQFAHEESRSF